jgi:tRNA A37 threonylcarbamoyladenosine dehydratase
LLQINSQCQVEIFDGFCVPETLDAIFQEPPDCVLDAIDSVHPKVRLIHYCVQHGIPIITCLGSALRLDPGRIRVADLSQTKCCPLAKQVRSRLGRLGIRNGIRCVYSDEPLKAQPQPPGPEDSTVERGRVRNTLASAALVPTAVGLFAAAEILTCLLGKNSQAG